MNATAQEKIEKVLSEPDSNRVRISLDRGLYPLDAIYGAAYVFIDRCFVFLDAPNADRVEVLLQGREPMDAAVLEAMAGEFANELLAHAWRHEITQANRPILEAITAQAMSGALGNSELDELDEMDFSEETFEDPLGIAMSWEEKYGSLADESQGEKDSGGDGVDADAGDDAESGAEKPKAEG